MTPENLTFYEKCIFMLRNQYSQNPHAQLSLNMYISYRVFLVLRPHCPTNDTELAPLPKHEKHCILRVMFLINRSYQKPLLQGMNNAPFYWRVLLRCCTLLSPSVRATWQPRGKSHISPRGYHVAHMWILLHHSHVAETTWQPRGSTTYQPRGINHMVTMWHQLCGCLI